MLLVLSGAAAQRPRAELPGGSGQLIIHCRAGRRAKHLIPWPSPPGQPKAAEGPAYLAGFVPDVFAGILVVFQDFSELLGGCKIQL
jgi:hypothetical protein